MQLHRILLTLAFSAVPCLAWQSPEAESSRSALEDEVAVLIEKGRTLLDDGQPADAQVVFEEAATLEADSLRTRMWVLRAWMDQGRSNDTLDGIDRLRDDGHAGAELDYLYGMAFVRRAEKLIAENTITSAVPMNITSGFELLHKVLPENERRFRDGWIALARAGWHEAGNRTAPEGAREARAVARDAADRAVAFYPHHADAHLMRGRVALSQFVNELPEGAASPADWGDAATHWEAAAKSFRAALELVDPTPEDVTRQMLAATAGMQLGNTLVWKGERQRAAHAYSRAIGWAPWGVDFQTIYNALFDAEADRPLEHVLVALEQGQAKYEEHFGTETEADATTLWWLGWARLNAGGESEGAASAFSRVLAKWPAYVDSWYYLALARYGSGDWAGATQALADGWSADAPTLLALMQDGDVDLNVARVEYLKSWAFVAGDLENAIALATLNAEAQPENPVFWNDLGLFLRDRGDQLRANTRQPPDPILLADLDERSWTAYSRALALDEENPQLLNDAAVILHYYLERDFDLARTMYRAAVRLAEAALDADDLDRVTCESYETALRDARNNLVTLDTGRNEKGAAR